MTFICTFVYVIVVVVVVTKWAHYTVFHVVFTGSLYVSYK